MYNFWYKHKHFFDVPNNGLQNIWTSFCWQLEGSHHTRNKSQATWSDKKFRKKKMYENLKGVSHQFEVGQKRYGRTGGLTLDNCNFSLLLRHFLTLIQVPRPLLQKLNIILSETACKFAFSWSIYMCVVLAIGRERSWLF